MADRGRDLGRPQAAAQACPPTTPPARVRRRTGADRRVRALVVRGPRPTMHAAGVYRRCDEPADASPVVESESTFAYFHATRAYLEAWGKPVAFYSDKHGVFRVNQPGALGGDGMTQFGRALNGAEVSSQNVIIQVAGTVLRMNTARCREAFNQSAE